MHAMTQHPPAHERAEATEMATGSGGAWGRGYLWFHSVNHTRLFSVAGVERRETKTCHSIRHFENTFVVETVICDRV